jgi:hypothetical protein
MPMMPCFDYRISHPNLVKYYAALAERPSFKATTPVMFDTDLAACVDNPSK